MKIFSLLLFCSTLLLFPADTKAADENNKIEMEIKYPDAAIKENLKDCVSVTFEVNDTGKIEIKHIESKYAIFKNSVQEQLSNFLLKQLDTNTLYRLVLHFNLL